MAATAAECLLQSECALATYLTTFSKGYHAALIMRQSMSQADLTSSWTLAYREAYEDSYSLLTCTVD